MEVLFFVEVVFFVVVVFLLPEAEEVVFFAVEEEVVFFAVEDDVVFFAAEEDSVFLPEEEVLAEDEEVVFFAEEDEVVFFAEEEEVVFFAEEPESVFLAEEDEDVFFPEDEDEVFFLAFGFLMTVVPLGLEELLEEELELVSVLVRLSRPLKRLPRPPEEESLSEEEEPPPNRPPSRLPSPPEEEPPPSRPPSRLPRPEEPPLLVSVLVRPSSPCSRGAAAAMILMTLLRSTPVFCATSRVCSSLGLPSAIRGRAAESTLFTSFCVAPLSLLISLTLPPERRSVKREDISMNWAPFSFHCHHYAPHAAIRQESFAYSLKKL